MKIAIALLSATAALTIPVYAFSADESANVQGNVQYKDNGGYSSSSSAQETDANGDKSTVKQSQDVDVDSKGNTTKHSYSEKVTNPAGSNNEKKQVTDVKTEQKDNGGYSKTVKTKDINQGGTDVTTKTNTDVNVDSKGNVTKTTQSEKTVDPKTGLFSGQTTKSETTTVNGQVVKQQTNAPNPANSSNQ